MAESTYGFRTSLGGFHKGDVIGYIEKVASQHRSQLLEYEQTLTTLREENHALQQQLSLLMMATPLASEAVPAAPVAPVEEPAPVVVTAPVAAPVPAQDKEELMWAELQAYRRAEAVERNAGLRVKKLYQQIEGMCDGAMEEFHATDAAVKQTIELILAQAKVLEQSYQALSDALCASREKLASVNNQLHTEAEE